ncbi:MAG: hypothetical protein MZV64_68655 [Ignavibacteriales bacterium]|nr:hypothetical protein [Ignavibacteriales bacterium]
MKQEDLLNKANGSAMVRYGDTMVLVTAVASPEAKPDQDFFPLQVEYREKLLPQENFPADILKEKVVPAKKKFLVQD